MVKCMLLSFYYTIGGRKLQRKLALRLKHFAQWRKSARASLRKPRHYRPACSFVLSSVTLQLIITAEAYISSAANLKPLPYYFPPMRQEKFSVTLKWNKKIFPPEFATSSSISKQKFPYSARFFLLFLCFFCIIYL